MTQWMLLLRGLSIGDATVLGGHSCAVWSKAFTSVELAGFAFEWMMQRLGLRHQRMEVVLGPI